MTDEYTQQSLTTVPNSLKTQLDRAQNLLAQSAQAESRGDNAVAVIKAREGLRVLHALAASSPAHATLVIAAEMGYRGFELETIEQVDQYQVVERKFLGIPVGYDVVNVPTITRRMTRARMI